MNRVLAAIRRLPRWLGYAGVAVVQIALIAALIGDRVRILRQGTEVALQTQPVDPRDLLRGDYVRLAYAISNVTVPDRGGQPSFGRGSDVYVVLAPDAAGLYEPVSVHAGPVAVTGRQRLIRGRVVGGTTCGGNYRRLCSKLTVDYGIERYFVPQGEGLAIERARNDRRVTVVAAVTPDGRAAIKRLLIDGKAVYDEPLF